MNDFVCVFVLAGPDAPSTLEECAAALRTAGLDGYIDGIGYVTVPCDGRAPEFVAAWGCPPATTMAPVW